MWPQQRTAVAFKLQFDVCASFFIFEFFFCFSYLRACVYLFFYFHFIFAYPFPIGLVVFVVVSCIFCNFFVFVVWLSKPVVMPMFH